MLSTFGSLPVAVVADSVGVVDTSTGVIDTGNNNFETFCVMWCFFLRDVADMYQSNLNVR